MRSLRKRGKDTLLSVPPWGTICSRADIIEYLWDNQLYVDDNALSVNINRIREKLSGLGIRDFIRTKHRQGYTI